MDKLVGMAGLLGMSVGVVLPPGQVLGAVPAAPAPRSMAQQRIETQRKI